MRRELEQQQAMIDASRLNFLKDYSSFAINVIGIVVIIACFLILAFIFHLLKWTFLSVLFGGSILYIPLAAPVILSDFTSHIKLRKKLNLFLPDLEKLYEIDKTMDVGFELNARGWFDESVVKAMMKKREKEIRDRARNPSFN